MSPTHADNPPVPETPAKPAKPVNPLLQACLEAADAPTIVVACTTAVESRQLKGEFLAAALYRRGVAQGMRGQLPAAVNDFSAGLKLTPDAVDLLNARASAYGIMKRYDLAIADYSTLLEHVPNDPDSLYLRARSAAALGRDAAAIADLTAVLAQEKNDIDALMDRGGLYLRQGAFDDAGADFTVILKAEPKAAAAFYNRGRGKFLKGDFAGATKDFAAAQKFRDDNPYAALRRYFANAQGKGDGKSRVAPEILTEAIGKFPADQWPLPILNALVGEMSEKDLLASAATVSDKAVARQLDAEAHYYLGEAALLKKDVKAARAHFTVAAKGDRNVIEVVDAGWRLKQLP